MRYRDEDIDTNDGSVNENKDALRPGNPDSPARSKVDQFTVTIRLPEGGVPVDRIRFPTRENIDAVRIYVYRPESDKPRQLNFGQVRTAKFHSFFNDSRYHCNFNINTKCNPVSILQQLLT